MLAGYDSVVRLTEEEKLAVPYIILANQFISTAYFADKDRYKELYETQFRLVLDMEGEGDVQKTDYWGNIEEDTIGF